jgi:2'-hydroxyisoflavone reductase
MEILVLGGTAWLGKVVAETALGHGHSVTALARGESGRVPAGVEFVEADRDADGAYAAVAAREWDAVVDVSRQPGHVRSALAALAGRTRRWLFVSSCSVYASHDSPSADESAALLEPVEQDDDDWETYGGRKVACERLVLARFGDAALVARSGLIGGPGDHSDRTGYWPLRFAHPATDDDSVLVPDSPVPAQVIDVRDLAGWLVTCAERGIQGVFNASGPPMPLADHLFEARKVAGHTGETVAVSPEWLVAHGVEPWSGEESLPLWLPLPEYAGFSSRSVAAANAAGLRARPLADTLADGLAWEMRQGPGRPRKAGLSAARERALIALARAEQG